MFESAITTITFALLLATFNERFFEHFIKPILDRFGAAAFTAQVALLTGLALSYALGVDFVGPLAEQAMGSPLPWPIAGLIVSGIIVGGGSNFVHDFTQMISVRAARPE